MAKKHLHNHCISLGFKKGTDDYWREWEAEKWRRLPYEVKKARWTRSRLQKKERLRTDPVLREKERERDRIRKAKQRLKNKELVNAKQRENYKRAGEKRKRKINDGKRRRNPTIGLASLIRDVRSGKRNARELIDRTSTAIAECRALVNRRTRTELPE